MNTSGPIRTEQKSQSQAQRSAGLGEHPMYGELKQIANRSPDALVVVDGKGVIRFQNERAQALFRAAKGGVLRSVLETVSTSEAGELECDINDETVFLELRASDVVWHSGPARLVSIRDRTYERIAGERAFEVQKMESIGRLASGLAHDFNNLLTVIIGYSDLLIRTAGNEPTETLEMLREIQLAGERAKNLTGQLIAFSRNSSPSFEILNAADVLRDVRHRVDRVIGDDVDLVIDIKEAKYPVRIDRARLEHIVSNLVANAKEAMPAGGTIEVKCDIVQCVDKLRDTGGLPPGDYVRIDVIDTGMGMNPDVMEHVFEPFFTTKSIGNGTGLGLATAYGITRQHGGNIVVSSVENIGSTFSVHLPLATSNDNVADMTRSDGHFGYAGNERILYVEDDETVRRVTQLGLIDSGYAVTAVADPQEALDFVDEHGWQFDLLISDVSMPGMNGYSMAEKLRASADRHIPAVFVTGHPPDDERFISDRSATDPVLQKPFKYGEFLECVRTTLHKAQRQLRMPSIYKEITNGGT